MTAQNQATQNQAAQNQAAQNQATQNQPTGTADQAPEQADQPIRVAGDSLELTVRSDPAGGGFEIRLRVGNAAPAAAPSPRAAPSQAVPVQAVAAVAAVAEMAVGAAASGGSGSPSSIPDLDPAVSARVVEVRAPLVGVFYSRPAPNDPPFVTVGDQVKAGASIAIVEAMKMMNHIPAPVSGRVVAIPAQDSSVVEFDEVLLAIDPVGEPV